MTSKVIAWLYERLDIVIMVNLIVSNLVNIIISAYITLLATNAFGDGIGLTYAIAIGTMLILVFGEIVPKKLAILFPVAFSRFASYVLYILYYVLYVIVVPLSKSMKFVDHYFKKRGRNEHTVIQEEIEAMLAMGRKDGALERKEYEMIKKLLLLNDKRVEDVMTRRADIIAVSQETTLRELLEIVAEHNFSRIPVYRERIDEIDWVVSIPKLIPFLHRPENLEKPISEFQPQKAHKVPESKIIDDLFIEFQKKRVHMAIVVDEFGNTSGLITMEDIVEEIFGDIEDETDERESKIEKIGKTEAKVAGEVTIREIKEIFKLNLDQREFPEEKSISWLILERLHRFPRQGEKIELKKAGLELTVLKMEDDYIEQVGIKL